MKMSVSVKSYSVQKDVISLKLNLKHKSQDIIDRLTEMKGKAKVVKLDELYLPGTMISSINITKTLSITLHVGRQSFIANKLFFLMEKEILDMFVNTNLEDDLAHYLTEVHKKQGRPKEDILYEVTTYFKEGKPHEGKRSIYDLSTRYQEVTLDKLRKIMGLYQGKDLRNSNEGVQNAGC